MRNNDAKSRQAYAATMSLLAHMAEEAEEASLGDLALYLDAARYELADGPWGLSSVQADANHSTFADGIAVLLATLEELRELTAEVTGLTAIAAARMHLADGIRHLDRVAERVAHEMAARGRPGAGAGMVDWRWVS